MKKFTRDRYISPAFGTVPPSPDHNVLETFVWSVADNDQFINIIRKKHVIIIGIIVARDETCAQSSGGS
jgi:hypothetical protein